jgi:hypothetical protein
MPARPSTPGRHAALARGSALIFALAIVLLLAVAGVAIVRYAGGDRVDAAKFGTRDRGLACAEAGLQYARKFFGSTYTTSNNWNDYLIAPTAAVPGYRFDPNAGDKRPTDFSTLPPQTRGMSNGTTFDPGADSDAEGRPTGQPNFWVSVRDDDDEVPLGAPNDPSRDNNELIIIRSECTNPAYAIVEGGLSRNVVLEAALSHVQGTSGYGIAAGGSNSADLVGNR